jgi:4-hydroxy-tetrahydrodipicolinate synthase
MPRFGEVMTAMVTPFTDDGRLDVAGAADLARWLVDQGNEGLVLAGTTGESPTLTDDEKVALWTSVRAAVDVPLLAGSTGYDTDQSVQLTQRATETGVDGILAVTPPYNRPSQAGIEAHFCAIAAATHLPVMLYDIPVRTGRKIELATMLRLAGEVGNIVGVKDAAGQPDKTAHLVALAPDGFEVYSGDDSMTLPLLAVGAVGVIGVATHWLAGLHRQMFSALDRGDLKVAREINARMLPSFAFETSDEAPNPVPAKAMMRVLGQPGGRCRLPMGPEPDGLADRARAIAADLDLTVAV